MSVDNRRVDFQTRTAADTYTIGPNDGPVVAAYSVVGGTFTLPPLATLPVGWRVTMVDVGGNATAAPFTLVDANAVSVGQILTDGGSISVEVTTTTATGTTPQWTVITSGGGGAYSVLGELALGVTGARFAQMLNAGDVEIVEGGAFITTLGDDLVLALAPDDRVTFALNVSAQWLNQATVQGKVTVAESAVGAADNWAWVNGVFWDDGTVTLAQNMIRYGNGGALPANVQSSIRSGMGHFDVTDVAIQWISELGDATNRAAYTDDAIALANGGQFGAHQTINAFSGTSQTDTLGPLGLGARARIFWQFHNRLGSTVPVATFTISHVQATAS